MQITCYLFNNIIIATDKGLGFVLPEIFFAIFILCFILGALWLKHKNILSKNTLFEKLFIVLFLYLGLVYWNNNIYVTKLLFNCTFLVDFYSITFKILVILTSFCLIIFTRNRKLYTFYQDN